MLLCDVDREPRATEPASLVLGEVSHGESSDLLVEKVDVVCGVLPTNSGVTDRHHGLAQLDLGCHHVLGTMLPRAYRSFLASTTGAPGKAAAALTATSRRTGHTQALLQSRTPNRLPSFPCRA